MSKLLQVILVLASSIPSSLTYPGQTNYQKCSKEGTYCSVKSQSKCCSGLTCRQNGYYNGGTCIKNCTNILEKCGNGVQCCAGLFCDEYNPMNGYGICRPVCSNESGICGTIQGNTCCDGLICQFPDLCCDYPGVCRRPIECQGSGQACGGSTSFLCCDGLGCSLGAQGPNFPGRCQPGCNGQGDICGGFAGIRCCNGLTCNTPAQCCDLPGVCEPACTMVNQPCQPFSGLSCCSRLTCYAGMCIPCRTVGQGCGVRGPACCGELGCNQDQGLCVIRPIG